MKRLVRAIAVSIALIWPTLLTAAPVVLDFEDLSDVEVVSAQYPGLTFTNAVALTAGISLNEFEFPPKSGAVVISDDGGPIRIDFATPLSAFGAYFTYAMPLTLSAFDAGSNFLGSATSGFSSNLALSGEAGSSPNEFLQLSASGIAFVTINGDPVGGSFVADNVTYEAGTTVPEPGTLGLLLLGTLAAGRRILRTRERTCG